MPVPLPSAADVLLQPPDAAEARHIAGGIAAAIAPAGGLTHLQRVLVEALTESMTGFVVPVTVVPKPGPEPFARGLARRNELFRARMVQFMLLGELVLVPLPAEVADRVEEYAAQLGVGNAFLRATHRLANGSLGLALVDFHRNGYMATWDPARTAHLHVDRALDEAWQMCRDDPPLAARWAALSECPEDSLGRGVPRF